MANIYDGGSMAPPAAPMGRGRMASGIHALRRMHPNHPIFKKYPGLASMFAQHARGPMPPEPVPTPTGQMPPTASGEVPPAGGPLPTATGPVTPPDTEIAGNFIPGSLEGYGGWGPPPQPESGDPMDIAEGHLRGMGGFGAGRHDPAARDRSPQGNIRDRLMQRYHTAGPQEPSLTSRAAMQHFLAKQGRNRQARQPMLPLRQAAHRRPY